MVKTTFIYALKELAPGEFQSSTIRYVGKANDPYRRFEEHCWSRCTSHLGNWVRSLSGRGCSLQLEILDEVPESQWQFWEREYIRVFRVLGFNLVNGTDGGEGISNPSSETRGKMSAAKAGKPLTGEHRRNIGLAVLGRKASPSTREKISRANLRENLSSEVLEKRRRGQRGLHKSNNSSGYPGVSWIAVRGKWMARATDSSGVRVYLGLFETREQAGAAREAAMHKYYGS